MKKLVTLCCTIFAVVLTLVLALPVLAATEDEETPTGPRVNEDGVIIITSIDITGIPEPEVGVMPSIPDTLAFSVYSDGYELTDALSVYDGTCWCYKNLVDGYPVESLPYKELDYPFNADCEYCFCTVLQLKEGYRFYGHVECTVNGRTAEYVQYAGYGNYIRIIGKFDNTPGVIGSIHGASINFPLPVAGKPVEEISVLFPDGTYVHSGLCWYTWLDERGAGTLRTGNLRRILYIVSMAHSVRIIAPSLRMTLL